MASTNADSDTEAAQAGMTITKRIWFDMLGQACVTTGCQTKSSSWSSCYIAACSIKFWCKISNIQYYYLVRIVQEACVIFWVQKWGGHLRCPKSRGGRVPVPSCGYAHADHAWAECRSGQCRRFPLWWEIIAISILSSTYFLISAYSVLV